MHIDRSRAQRAFHDYVDAYDARNPRISLKVDHTLRVADLAARIATAEGLAPDDVDLAWLIGLLHDMGRFEQIRRWGTFSDARSTSHAALGIEVVLEQEAGTPPFDADRETADFEPGVNIYAGLSPRKRRLRDFVSSAEEDELIRQAIGTHSDLALPKEITGSVRTFCNIVRDADKLDILHTVATSTPETILGVDEAALAASHLSPAVLEAFEERRCVKREERVFPADYVVGFLCFAFELVYPESRRIAAEAGDLFAIAHDPFNFSGTFADPEVPAELSRMEADLRSWLGDANENGAGRP